MSPKSQRTSPRSGKARRSPRQGKVRVPLQERSPVPQIPREERTLQNKKERIRRKNELMKSKKVSIRTQENCRCRWRVYGCEYSAKHSFPSGTTIIGHETSCVFKPERMVGEICQIVKNFQAIYGQTILDLDRILNPGSVHKMKPVEILASDCTLKSTPPRPVIFNSAGCWQNGPPTPGAMFEGVLNARRDSTGAALNKHDIVTVARQIAFGDYTPENVQSIHDIDPASNSGKSFIPAEQYPMIIPAQLQKGELLECYPVFDATPTHTFTDLCIERALSTMAIHEGNICNLWMLWPPTPSNEKVFHHHRCSDDVLDDKKPGPIFRKVVPMLTSGRMTIVKPGQAIYIPSGWIYSTLTLNGGYLPKLHMLTREILPKTMIFSKKEVKLSTTEGAERSLNTLIDSVVALMRSGKIEDEKEGLLVWIDIVSMMEDFGGTWSDEIKRRSVRIYNEYINTPQDEEDGCEEERRLESRRKQEKREWERMKQAEEKELEELDEEERQRNAEWEKRKWMERELEKKKKQEIGVLEKLNGEEQPRNVREREQRSEWEIRELEEAGEREREARERRERKQWEAEELEKRREQELLEESQREEREWDEWYRKKKEDEESKQREEREWVKREQEELRDLEEIEEYKKQVERDLEGLGKLIEGF